MSEDILYSMRKDYKKKRVEFTTRFGLLEFNRFEESIKAIEIEDLVERAKHILVLLESEFGRKSFNEAMIKWWSFRQYDFGEGVNFPLVSEIEGYDENFDWSRKAALVLKQIGYELECSVGYSIYISEKD